MTPRYYEMLTFSLYFTVFCIALLLFFAMVRGIGKKKNSGLLLIILILVVISSIRVNSGSDFYNYYIMYNNSTNYFRTISDIFSNGIQGGYMVISFVTKNIIGGEFSIFTVCAIITNGIACFSIYKYSKFPLMSVAIYLFMGYFLMSNNILKQAIAMGIMMLAVFQFYNKKYILFSILSILACVFHISSIVFIIIIILSKFVKISYGFLTSIILSSLFLMPISIFFLKKITTISIFSRYQNYVLNTLEVADYRFILSTIFFTCVHIFILYVIVKKLRYIKIEKNSLEEFLIKIMFLCVGVSIISLRLYYLNRISFFGFQLLIILIPNLIGLIPSKIDRKKIRYKLFCFLIAYCFIFTIFSGENNYYNYSTRFNDYPVSVQDFVRRSN